MAIFSVQNYFKFRMEVPTRRPLLAMSPKLLSHSTILLYRIFVHQTPIVWCTKAWISHQTHLPLLPGESDGPVVAVGVEQAFRFLGTPGTGRVGGGGDAGLE